MEKLEFRKVKKTYINNIMDLYKQVIKITFTTWDDNYPSKELVLNDIKNRNLYAIFDEKIIIAVSYLGENEDEKEDWQFKLHKPLGVARICVNPNFQGRGVGTYFMRCLIEEAKRRKADGMHFHVCTNNISAIRMYEKVGFKNCGLGKSKYGYDYYKFEQVFKD